MNTLIDPSLLDEIAKHKSRAAKYVAGSHRGAFGLARLLPDDDDDEIEEAVAEGCMIEFGKAIEFNGELIAFTEDAFDKSLASKANILYCADHDQQAVLADTQSGGVEIVKRSDGLFFRCDVRKSFNPLGLLGIISSKSRRAISIGFSEQSSETHKCGGRSVKFITRADLVEFSSVAKGRNTGAFAFITCGKKNRPPSANFLSDAFKRNETTFRAETGAIKPTVRAFDWHALSRRVTAIEAQLGMRKPAAFAVRVGSPAFYQTDNRQFGYANY